MACGARLQVIQDPNLIALFQEQINRVRSNEPRSVADENPHLPPTVRRPLSVDCELRSAVRGRRFSRFAQALTGGDTPPGPDIAPGCPPPR